MNTTIGDCTTGHQRSRLFRLLCAVLCFSLISGALLVFINRAIPYDMDEFLEFAPLARILFPLSSLNPFRENFQQYDLTPTGIWSWLPVLPFRSYRYVGSAAAFLYAPLYLLIPEMWTVRFFGLCFLAVQAWAISRLYGYRWWCSFLSLILFMPYALQHVIDFGQLCLQTTSVFLMLLLIKRWKSALESHQVAWMYPAAGALLLFVCFWIRPLYIALLVPLLLILLIEGICMLRMPSRRVPVMFHAFIFCMILFPLMHLLLTSLTVARTSYLSFIIEFCEPGEGSASQFSLREMVNHGKWLFSEHFLNLLATVKVVKQVAPGQSSLVSGLFWAGFGLIIAGGIAASPRRSRTGVIAAGFLLLALIAAGFIAGSKRSWAMHHGVLIMPFLLCTFFETWAHVRTRIWARGVLLGMLSINIYLYALLPGLENAGRFGFSALPRLNEEINRRYSDTHMIIVRDWGLFYPKILFGTSSQIVIWPWDDRDLEMSVDMAEKRGLKALIVTHVTRVVELRNILQRNIHIESLPFETTPWQLVTVGRRVVKRQPHLNQALAADAGDTSLKTELK